MYSKSWQCYHGVRGGARIKTCKVLRWGDIINISAIDMYASRNVYNRFTTKHQEVDISRGHLNGVIPWKDNKIRMARSKPSIVMYMRMEKR